MSAVLQCSIPSRRPMTVTDLEAVLAIEREAYEFPWSEGIFRWRKIGSWNWIQAACGQVSRPKPLAASMMVWMYMPASDQLPLAR